ncbi:MAG: hypothetical protein JJV99_02375, partial [Colwellia sp.]|nr:hypothetical protein [Colwellia sp.]
MTKIQFTLLSFILAALFSSSMVSANPMKSVQKVNPIPMFMPILVKQSDKLALTPKQVDAFAKWRGENMAPAVKATTAIIEGEKAVKKATLEG